MYMTKLLLYKFFRNERLTPHDVIENNEVHISWKGQRPNKNIFPRMLLSQCKLLTILRSNYL